jgi:hypothetical protein
MTRLSPVQHIHILAIGLTSAVRSFAISERLRACSSRVHYSLTPALCLLLGVILIQMQPAQAATKADQYKLYAHSRILNFNEFLCFQKIIHKESRWNPRARNGSHHGLGQMRSEWYKTLDPYRQIDQTLIYIHKRYSTPCKAWEFHKRKNYF